MHLAFIIGKHQVDARASSVIPAYDLFSMRLSLWVNSAQSEEILSLFLNFLKKSPGIDYLRNEDVRIAKGPEGMTSPDLELNFDIKASKEMIKLFQRSIGIMPY